MPGVAAWPPSTDLNIDDPLPWDGRSGRWRGYLPIEVGLGHLVRVPVVAVGSGLGPSLVAVAGIHGDEFDASASLRAWMATLESARLHGTVVAILCANPLALAERSRTTPRAWDGLDLARVFPGSCTGSPTQRLADAIWRIVRRTLRGGGALVDMHSGGTHYAYARLAGFRATGMHVDNRSQALAAAFGFDRLWSMDPESGSLTTETSLAGIPSIGCEVTGRAGIDSQDVAAYSAGLRRLLDELGILGTASESTSSFPLQTTRLVTDVDGFARQLPSLGRKVTTGDPLAVLTDVFGMELSVVRAPHPGEVWAARTCPALAAGDIIALLSNPTKAGATQDD